MPRVYKYEALYLEQKRRAEESEAENSRLLKALESESRAERRLKALGAQRVHWGWGEDEDRYTYCCARGPSLFREKTLEDLADALIEDDERARSRRHREE